MLCTEKNGNRVNKKPEDDEKVETGHGGLRDICWLPCYDHMVVCPGSRDMIHNTVVSADSSVLGFV